MSEQDVDVLVIGGGPAGSISALTLAQRGHSVLLLEREEFPRFHIGESLLPYLAGLLEQLNIYDVVAAQGYVEKWGGEFIDPTETRFFDAVFRADFSIQGDGRHDHIFQVERAKFDKMLLEQAEAAGATVLQGAEVFELLMDGDRMSGARYRRGGEKHEVRSRYVVDASGRAGKIAHKFGLRKKIDRLQMVGVFRHYTGYDEQNNLGAEGDIQIGVHDDGWVWAIPLDSDTISVGTVMPREVFRRSTPEAAFEEHRARVPRIVSRLKGTVPATNIKVETDYCYKSDTVAGNGWVMAGDAGCFGDPMFSGGVTVAAATGFKAGQAVSDALREPERAEEHIQHYSNFYKTGYDTYIRLIQGFYQGELLAVTADAARTTDRAVLEKYMVRLMGGDFWSEHNPLCEEMRARSEWDTFEPFERTKGCPAYPQYDELDRKHLAEARVESAPTAG
ncbi:NAD(P)/FAD-dependent oxidoreductase [Streptomyces sp. NPDC059894]|uniref:NAD(P)/FAD-dependent oxidoreductase n=1 Tax=unclassified Streptomyces TaxID=2593676 RepID=UPI003660C506